MSTIPMSLLDLVTQRVTDRTSRRVRNLEVEIATAGDHIVLRGRANSYHVKQLAQQGVRETVPHARLENAIVVE